MLNDNILSNKNFEIFRSEFVKRVIIYGKSFINKKINLNKTTKKFSKIEHYLIIYSAFVN